MISSQLSKTFFFDASSTLLSNFVSEGGVYGQSLTPGDDTFDTFDNFIMKYGRVFFILSRSTRPCIYHRVGLKSLWYNELPCGHV